MSGPKVPSRAAAQWPVIAAIVLNLVPIVGVVFWGWSAFALIFLYWLENVVIGFRALASIAANALLGPEGNPLGALFHGAFFAAHYGLFCFGHGTFVVLLFGSAGGHTFDLAGATGALFAQQPGLVFGLTSIVLWQGVLFAMFIVSGEARRTSALELMGAPYPRIIVLHLTILAGGFLLLLLNQPITGLVFLALIKTAFDVVEARRAGHAAQTV